MLLEQSATKVVLIQGMSMYINKCSTIECPLFRYGICKNEGFWACFDYQSWNNMSEDTKDEIRNIQIEKLEQQLKEK